MANKKLSALDVGVLTDATEIYLNAGGSKKTTMAAMRSFLGGVGTAYKGAMASMVANETGANYSADKSVPFDDEVYDFGGWHDKVTLNDRLTVPTGVTKVRLTANIQTAGETANENCVLTIRKNGTGNFVGTANQAQYNDETENYINAATPVIEVAAGDYFTLHYNTEADTSITVLAITTSFAIEAVEVIVPAQAGRGALAHKVADETADYSTQAAVPWDKEARDTDSIHDTATNNTRMTVPTGVTLVQLQGSVLITGATSGEHANLYLTKNGVQTAIGLPSTKGEVTDTVLSMAVASAVLEVTAGDYFELELEVETDTSVTLDNDRSWFSLEIVEATLVPGGAGKQTLTIPVSAMTPTFSNGCSGSMTIETTAGMPDQHVMYFRYDVGDEHAQWEFCLPKAWNLGTLSFKAKWTHQGGQTGGLDGVAWGLQAVSLASGDDFATAYGSPKVVTDDQATADKIYMTAESAALTVAGTLADGQMQVFRVFRDISDGADDLDIDAGLVGIVLFFTTDKATDD